MQKQIIKFIEYQLGITDTKFVPNIFGAKPVRCRLIEILNLHIFEKVIIAN